MRGSSMTHQQRRALWFARVRDWRGSGLSMAEFCRRHDLKRPTLAAWVKRDLQSIACEANGFIAPSFAPSPSPSPTPTPTPTQTNTDSASTNRRRPSCAHCNPCGCRSFTRLDAGCQRIACPANANVFASARWRAFNLACEHLRRLARYAVTGFIMMPP